MGYRCSNTEKITKFFYQFQFRELLIFAFKATIKYSCFHRFFTTQKELKEIIMQIKRLYRDDDHGNKIW